MEFYNRYISILPTIKQSFTRLLCKHQFLIKKTRATSCLFNVKRDFDSADCFQPPPPKELYPVAIPNNVMQQIGVDIKQFPELAETNDYLFFDTEYVNK